MRDDTFRMQSAKLIMRSLYLCSTSNSYLSVVIWARAPNTFNDGT